MALLENIEIRELPIGELVENTGQIPNVPKNPRKITKEKFNNLVESIRTSPEMRMLDEVKVFPYDGKYVLLLTKLGTGEDITGSKLTDIAQAPGYLGHQTATFDELAFFCQYAEYNERNDEKGNPAYYLDLIIANGTPMDYDAVVLAKFYKANTEGSYDPVVFPAQPNIYTNLQLSSNMWRAVSIRLAEALESGEYGLELYIANDFHSRYPQDYFIFASSPITVAGTTGIEMLNEDCGVWNDDSWYTLDGRRLSGKPTAKGLYIHKGKAHIVK